MGSERFRSRISPCGLWLNFSLPFEEHMQLFLVTVDVSWAFPYFCQRKSTMTSCSWSTWMGSCYVMTLKTGLIPFHFRYSTGEPQLRDQLPKGSFCNSQKETGTFMEQFMTCEFLNTLWRSHLLLLAAQGAKVSSVEALNLGGMKSSDRLSASNFFLIWGWLSK